MRQYLIPALQKAKITDVDAIMREVGVLFSNRSAAQLVNLLATQQGRINKDLALLDNAPGLSTADRYMTHDFDVAAAADRVGILDRGRIKTEGVPGELLRLHFDARVRLRLGLNRTADPMLEAALRAAGLLFSAAENAWHAPSAGVTQATVDRVLAAVAAGQCDVRALAVVEPGLRDLYDTLLAEGAPT